ncbi:hypothetical protein TWF730_000130 [Orbilia blumenaviensis]|uniref:Uncharacterized protein n=1 Tax=Orbilia blumenaviensis TaxID=1796055 RepID=A0AAV9VKL2_9PEZI
MAEIAGMLGDVGADILSDIISDEFLKLISGPSQDLAQILQKLDAINESLNIIAASVNQSMLDTIKAIPEAEMSDITTYISQMQNKIQTMHDDPTASGLAQDIDTFCGIISQNAQMKAQRIHDALVVGIGGLSGVQQMWNNLSGKTASPFDPVEVYKIIKYFSLYFEGGLKKVIVLLTFQMQHDLANPKRQFRGEEAQGNITAVNGLIANWDAILEAPVAPLRQTDPVIPPSIQQMAQAWLSHDGANPLILAWDRFLSSGPFYGVKAVVNTKWFHEALKLENYLCNSDDQIQLPMRFSFYRNNSEATYKIGIIESTNFLGLYSWSSPIDPTASGTLLMPVGNILTPQPSPPVSQEWFQIKMLPGTFDGNTFLCVLIVVPSNTTPSQSSGNGLVVNALYGGAGAQPADYRLVSVDSCSLDPSGLANLGSDYIWRLRSPTAPP